MTRKQVLRIAINFYRTRLGLLPEIATIEEYDKDAQTALVRLDYISDIQDAAHVEIDLKKDTVRLMRIYKQDSAKLYVFETKFNDTVKF